MQLTYTDDNVVLDLPPMSEKRQVISAWDVRSLIESSRQKEHQNDLADALALATQAEKAFAKCVDKSDELKADLLQHLAQIHRRRQDFDKLDAYSRTLLDISRQIKDESLEATALLNLGIVRSIESDYRSAMTHFVESLAQSERVGFRSNVAHCLINIGNVYANLFNYEDALDRYEKAITDYADVLNDTTRIAINLNIGNLCHTTEQYDLANEYFERGLEIADETAQNDMSAHAHTLICRNLLADKRSIEAKRHINTKNGAANHPINLLNIAEIHFAEGNTEGATQQAVNGIEAAKSAKDDTSELRGFRLLADIYEKIGDFKRAFRAEKIYSTKQVDYLRMQRTMHALDLEIRFSLREKQQRIEELTRENSFQGILLEKSDQIAQQNGQLKQANEELQQFAYITSHDLKEPLRMIGSFSQVIQQTYSAKLGGESAMYFRYINDGVNRMNALLDALLQYATIGKIEIEPEVVDIQEVVGIAKDNLHVKIEETFGSIMCGALPNVMSMQSLLVQLFQNLIGNALKFNKPDSRPIVLINAEDRRDHWLFSVEDNGIGIDAEHCERIFVIFQRLHGRDKYEGTGIGLSICQKIVHQLGGKIWVESEPLKGATFFFTLPK
jgi:signal transduction histidine kinase